MICQSILDGECKVDIYDKGERVITFTGRSSTDVWEKLPILKKFGGKELFGLHNQLVMQEIQNDINRPYCKLGDWDNIEMMTYACERHLKKTGISFFFHGCNRRPLSSNSLHILLLYTLTYW